MNRRDAEREWGVALVLATVHGAQHLTSGLLAPLIPILAIALEYPLWQLGLLATVYSLVSGVAQAPMGELSDRFDRRFVLPPGVALMGTGYVVFGFAPSLGTRLPPVSVAGVALAGPFLVMVGGMAICGFGSSTVHPMGYPLVSANVAAERKGWALGIWGSASKFGDTLAPIAVALLVLVLPWHHVVLVMGLFVVTYAAVLFGLLGREQIVTTPPRAAPVEAATAAPGATRSDPRSVLDDRRAFVYPMLAVVLFFIARGVATKGVRTFVPTFVTDVYGYSLTLFGTTIGPTSLANAYFSALLLTAAVVQLGAGELTDRYDHRKVIVVMFAAATLGLAALSFVELSPVVLLVVLLVVGGGIWGANPARDTLVSDISPAEWEGRTFGYLWTVSQFFSAASPAVIGYLADVSGIQDSFKYLALATLLAALIAGLMLSDRVYLRTVGETPSPSD